MLGRAALATGLGAMFGVAAAAAGVTAQSLRKRRADRQRYALIRGAALIADAGGTTAEVVERVRALLVPAFADTCEIQLGDGEHHPGATLVVPLAHGGGRSAAWR